MFSLLDNSLAEEPPSQQRTPSVLNTLSRNPSAKLFSGFDPMEISGRPSPTGDVQSFMHSGLFSGGSTLRSAIDPLDNIKKVDSMNSQSYPVPSSLKSSKSSPQYGAGIRLPPPQPAMRVRSFSAAHSAKPPLPPSSSTTTVVSPHASRFGDDRPLPITSSKTTPSTTKNSSSSAALDALLFGEDNNKRATYDDDSVSHRHRSAPEIVVDHPTPFQSSTVNSRASSEIIPSAKSTPTIQVGSQRNSSSPVNKWDNNNIPPPHQQHHQGGRGVYRSSNSDPPHPSPPLGGRGSDWDMMRGATRTEASCLLDKLYFNASVQHFLDFGDTVGNMDKNGNVLVEGDVRAALIPNRSVQKSDTSLHALQSRLLHQLHLIDIPDLEKARVASSTSTTNNFIVRSILNSRHAQNTELLPVKVAMPPSTSSNNKSDNEEPEDDKYQAFSCGFCGLGEHGAAPALLLLDARYHGPNERIDHCPSCGMYQGA